MKTETKATRLHRLLSTLEGLGFTTDEAHSLRRIEMTLHRWSEHECNGNIQREEHLNANGWDDGTGRPFWYFETRDGRHLKSDVPIADRERGALRRLEAIVTARNERVRQEGRDVGQQLKPYHQGDPRGAALYLVRLSDLRVGDDIGAVYSRGICVAA